MASLQLKNRSYYCQFIFRGKRRTVTVGRVTPDEAAAFAGNVDYLLLRLKQGFLRIPPAVDDVEFVRHNGNVPTAESPPADELSFDGFRARYFEAHDNGALEANSLATIAMHLRHFERSLGARFLVGHLTQADLQRHVNRRAATKGVRGRPLSPVTIRKEVASLRAAWNWGVASGLVRAAFPNKGLVYPEGGREAPVPNTGGDRAAD
jgi:hypothetical protein